MKNLFFNVPARRKFLKANSTELSNILAEFERIVLVHPDVAFYLYSNDSELFNLPVMPLRQRIMAVFGKLLSVEVDTTLVRISGYVAKPETARKKGAHQYFFVNGRYMRHPYFHKAVMDAFEHLIPVGEQISYFIYLEVDPANIDVNIHPTKTEIKFENEQAIWQILSAAVKESLGKFSAVPSIDFDTDGLPDIPAFEEVRPVEPPQVHYNADFNPFKSSSSSYSSGSSYSRKPVEWEGLYAGLEKASRMNDDVTEPAPAAEEEVQAVVVPASPDAGASLPVSAGGQHWQFKGRYILTSVKSGLMLIDQHRAHVRVLFDRYMEQIRQKQGVAQGVLFPEIVQFPASEVAMLESILDDLSAVGFELTSLGGGSYAINGVPAGIEGLNPVELVRNMVHTALEKGSDVKEEVQTLLALTLARAAAIVYGQALSNEEMSALVDSLFACATPGYTPDGRTVLTTLKDEDLEKLFAKGLSPTL